MILLVDIGNTNIKFGLADKDSILGGFVLPTDITETSDSLGLKILQMLQFNRVEPGSIQAWVVSSVVPLMDSLLKQAGQRFCHCPVYFVPDDISLGLQNKYSRPSEVGADRLTCAFAARKLYANKGLIVIDFGTATTFDCVYEQDYLGGLICPGVLSSIKALSTQTAKLPQINLDIQNKELEIGRSTKDSLSQGIIFGFASLVDGLVSKLERKLGEDVFILATGGFADKIASVCTKIQEVRPDLLLHGLKMAYYIEKG
ncbi:type III pantothenate kinase [Desulfohalobiaceae bacterium Ax17]|uniref:type III pantothenate kinase n=1 Tax=Desulfovulcanus ferrireducens TaxID=2831190 RepID=UPI00207BBF7B|nr:type III pantothenate kinase [Desulfovulcanus ferrireducens]MBT8763506.1 type III pantothenate kinase [Desulfovulcanus ferrireducens]